MPEAGQLRRRRLFGRGRNRRRPAAAGGGRCRRAWRLGCRVVPPLLAAVALGFAALGAWGLGQQLVRSPMLRLREVRIVGAERAPLAELQRPLAPLRGQPLLQLDVAAVAARAANHPWVRDARVRRHLPDGLVVDVIEHVPTLLVALDVVWVADEDGILFKPLAAADRLDLPVLTGLAAPGAAAAPAALAAAAPPTARPQLPQEAQRRVREAMVLAAAADHRATLMGSLQELHWQPEVGWSVVTAAAGGATAQVHLGHAPVARLAAVQQTLSYLAEQRQAASIIWADGDKNPGRVSVRLRTPALGAAARAPTTIDKGVGRAHAEG